MLFVEFAETNKGIFGLVQIMVYLNIIQQKKTFTNYYADDGLQGNEFSKNALFKDKSGEIIFGGVNGVTSFFPEKITNPAKKLDIRITGFYIHDQAINKGDKSGSYNVIDTAVSEAKKIPSCSKR